MSRDGGRYTGEYGAEGLTPGEAFARELDRMAVETGVTSFHARISYLTRSEAGYRAMDAAGLDVTRQTMVRWLAEEQGPSRASREAVDRAYVALRRERIARTLKDRLTEGGRGRQVEVHPVDQTPVQGGRKRELSQRRITPSPRQWEKIVDAWAKGDLSDIDDVFDDIAEADIGSDYAAYSWVAAVGFG